MDRLKNFWRNAVSRWEKQSICPSNMVFYLQDLYFLCHILALGCENRSDWSLILCVALSSKIGAFTKLIHIVDFPAFFSLFCLLKNKFVTEYVWPLVSVYQARSALVIFSRILRSILKEKSFIIFMYSAQLIYVLIAEAITQVLLPKGAKFFYKQHLFPKMGLSISK